MSVTFSHQTLHEGDFLRLWQGVRDQSIDLILTDPPYGAITQAQPWDEQPDFHSLRPSDPQSQQDK